MQLTESHRIDIDDLASFLSELFLVVLGDPIDFLTWEHRVYDEGDFILPHGYSV
jgi:hypothetical protein